MSKTIPIPVQVPDWVTHIAQDEDGCWGVYDCKPVKSTCCWMPNGRYLVYPYDSVPNPNWRETLREVE